jgi:hypothetical protein
VSLGRVRASDTIQMTSNVTVERSSRWPRFLLPSPGGAQPIALSTVLASAGAAVAVVAYALVLVILPAGSPGVIALSNLGSFVAAGVAAVLCLLAGRRHQPGRARLSWMLLGIGLACWAYGDGYWAWSEIVVGETPGVPSWADIGYISMIVFVLIGTALTPITRPREISRGRLALDATIILAAIGAMAWSVALAPMFNRLETDPLTQAVTLLYPVGSLGSLLLLSILMLRSAETSVSIRLLTIGWGLIAAADVAYVVLAADDAYATGNPADLFWFTGAVLIGLAAALDRPAEVRPVHEHDVGQRWQMVVPIVLVIVVRVVMVLQESGPDGLHVRPEQALLGLAAVLLVVRIAVGYRDIVLIRELYAQRAREQEASHRAQEEAARLQGVILTGRELSHLLSNDLAMAVGWIDLLREHPDLPPDLREVVDDAAVGLERAADHLKRLQQVNRVATRETPMGPALDLAQSAARPDDGPPPASL